MNMDLDAPFVIPNAVRNPAGKKDEILRFALNDKRPNAEGHPPSPPSKGGKSEAKGGCYPFNGGKERSEALGKQTEREFRKWAQITAFVIPNTPSVIPNAVRNLARKRKEILRLRSE